MTWRKTISVIVMIFLIAFPYFLFKIELSNTNKILNFYKEIAINEFENYMKLITDYVNVKDPDGYIVDKRIYFNKELYNINSLPKDGLNIIELSNQKLNNIKKLVYVSGNKIFELPNITSKFIFILDNEYIINSQYNFQNIKEIFPIIDTSKNITYFNGKKIILKNIKLSENVSSIIYAVYPKHSLLLYFISIPISLLWFYFIFIYDSKNKKAVDKKLKKLSIALKITKDIAKKYYNDPEIKQEIIKLKKVLKED